MKQTAIFFIKLYAIEALFLSITELAIQHNIFFPPATLFQVFPSLALGVRLLDRVFCFVFYAAFAVVFRSRGFAIAAGLNSLLLVSGAIHLFQQPTTQISTGPSWQLIQWWIGNLFFGVLLLRLRGTGVSLLLIRILALETFVLTAFWILAEFWLPRPDYSQWSLQDAAYLLDTFVYAVCLIPISFNALANINTDSRQDVA